MNHLEFCLAQRTVDTQTDGEKGWSEGEGVWKIGHDGKTHSHTRTHGSRKQWPFYGYYGSIRN